MNVKKKILVVLLIIGLPLQMCTSGDDDCNCSNQAPFFDINGLSLQHYITNSFDEIISASANTSVTYDEYLGVVGDYSVDYISRRCNKKTPSFQLVTPMYACSCIENGESGSKFEKLTNVTVITLNDFNETYQANDTINELVLMNDWRNGSLYSGSSNIYIDEFLANDSLNVRFEKFRLLVDQKPKSNSNFKIKVIIELSTGEVYETTSEAIEIL